MKAIANIWVLLAVCFSAGLWLAAPRPASAQDACRGYATGGMQCLVGEDQYEYINDCLCGSCTDERHFDDCQHEPFTKCIIFFQGELVSIDLVDCVVTGSCSCAAPVPDRDRVPACGSAEGRP